LERIAAVSKPGNGPNSAMTMNVSHAMVAPKRVDPAEQALFRARLRDALNGRSVNSFAKQVPVRQYLIGESEPTRPVVLAIARAAGVSPSWLAFGIGARSD
jgi:hypothetical protein